MNIVAMVTLMLRRHALPIATINQVCFNPLIAGMKFYDEGILAIGSPAAKIEHQCELKHIYINV